MIPLLVFTAITNACGLAAEAALGNWQACMWAGVCFSWTLYEVHVELSK